MAPLSAVDLSLIVALCERDRLLTDLVARLVPGVDVRPQHDIIDALRLKVAALLLAGEGAEKAP